MLETKALGVFQTLIVEKQGGDGTIAAVNALQNVIVRVSEGPQARLKEETPNPRDTVTQRNSLM